MSKAEILHYLPVGSQYPKLTKIFLKEDVILILFVHYREQLTSLMAVNRWVFTKTPDDPGCLIIEGRDIQKLECIRFYIPR